MMSALREGSVQMKLEAKNGNSAEERRREQTETGRPLALIGVTYLPNKGTCFVGKLVSGSFQAATLSVGTEAPCR